MSDIEQDVFEEWFESEHCSGDSTGVFCKKGFMREAWYVACEWQASANAEKAVSVPDGWKLVPIESTSEMDLAAEDTAFDTYIDQDHAEAIWDAMIAVSPATPAPTKADEPPKEERV